MPVIEPQITEAHAEHVKDGLVNNEHEAEIVQRLSEQYADVVLEESETSQPVSPDVAARTVVSAVPVVTAEISWPMTSKPANAQEVPQPPLFRETIWAAEATMTLTEDPVEIAEIQLPTVEAQAPHTEANTAAQAWESVLSAEPIEIYERFRQALAVVAEDIHEQTDSELVGDWRPVPSVMVTITERLAELSAEAKEPIALAMQDVIGALHGIQVLEARSASPEIIAAVEEQLRQLCAALLEELAIEYTEQDIEDFVAVLRSPRFAPEALDEPDTKINDLGTHEIKYFARMTNVFSNAEDRIQFVIGTFVLNTLGLRSTNEAV